MRRSEPKAPKAAKKTAPQAPEPPSQPESIATPPTVPPATTQNQDGPSLHIDIQIHIPADADPDQIDQIFASMAKHLYPQRAGE